MEAYIEGYDKDYLINTKGEVFSLKKEKKKMYTSLNNCKYHTVELCINGKRTRHSIHRLVAKAFIPNPENKTQVNHIDGNKSNNCLSNLEWNTASENQLHSISLGLRTAKGIKNSQSKLDESSVMIILNDDRTYKYIAQEYNISISTVSDIKRGYSWTHITGLKIN